MRSTRSTHLTILDFIIITHLRVNRWNHSLVFVRRGWVVSIPTREIKTLQGFSLLSISMGWNDDSELRPPKGLVFTPQMMNGEPWWNDIGRGKQKTRGKAYPSTTMSTTNPTRTDPASNSSHLGGRSANHLNQRLFLVAAGHDIAVAEL
jgi:hypothetical protein